MRLTLFRLHFVDKERNNKIFMLSMIMCCFLCSLCYSLVLVLHVQSCTLVFRPHSSLFTQMSDMLCVLWHLISTCWTSTAYTKHGLVSGRQLISSTLCLDRICLQISWCTKTAFSVFTFNIAEFTLVKVSLSNWWGISLRKYTFFAILFKRPQ